MRILPSGLFSQDSVSTVAAYGSSRCNSRFRNRKDVKVRAAQRSSQQPILVKTDKKKDK